MGGLSSSAKWHPELRIGFAYVTSFFEWLDWSNSREGLPQKEVVKCVNMIALEKDVDNY